jgi:hypothetical protein
MDPEKLYELKKRYGSIFSTLAKNQEVFFRELTFEEYDKIIEYKNSDAHSSVDIEDIIIGAAVIYPEDFNINSLPPGLISSLSQQIVDVSGFYSAKIAKKILEDKREKANEVRSLMKAFVLATIHTYNPKDLDGMTFSQLAENVALSEKIIEIQQSINGVEPTNINLQLIDPEEEVEKKKTSEARHNLSKKEGEASYSDPIAQKLWGMQ